METLKASLCTAPSTTKSFYIQWDHLHIKRWYIFVFRVLVFECDLFRCETNDFSHWSCSSGRLFLRVCVCVLFAVMCAWTHWHVPHLLLRPSRDILSISPAASPIEPQGGKCFIVHRDSIKTHNVDSLSWFQLSLWCPLNAAHWVFSSRRQAGSTRALVYVITQRGLHVVQLWEIFWVKSSVNPE